MDFKLSIFFTNGKDLSIVFKKEELDKFLNTMTEGKPYWNEGVNNGLGVPIHNIMYYTFVEYTEEMKKADQERMKPKQEVAKEKNKGSKVEQMPAS